MKSWLQDLIHKNAPVIVGGLYTGIDKLLVFFGKAAEAERTVMAKQAVFGECIDVQSLYACNGLRTV